MKIWKIVAVAAGGIYVLYHTYKDGYVSGMVKTSKAFLDAKKDGHEETEET